MHGFTSYQSFFIKKKQFALKYKARWISYTYEKQVYMILRGTCIKSCINSMKNELFSDSHRTFKNNTVRIAVSEDLNQNLQCN